MRNSTLDVAKGIGILLVLIGHGSWGAPTLFKYIYSFHMPMFFIISGYFFQSRQFGETIKKYFDRLIVPYFIIGLACAVPAIVFGHTASVDDFVKQVAGTIYSVPKSDWTFYCTPIWFLTCLFCTTVAYSLIVRMRQILVHATVTASMLAAAYVLKDGPIYLPWNAGVAMIAIFFFHIGAQARKHGLFSPTSSRRKHSMLLIPVTAAFALSVEASTTSVNMSAGFTGNIATFLAASLLGSVMVMLISSLLRDVRLLSFFGANTVILFGLNYWVLKLGNSIAPAEYGWLASFAVQVPFYFALAGLSQNNNFVSIALKRTPA